MSETLFLATASGLAVWQRINGEWRESGRALANLDVTSVVAREGVTLAGTTEGIYRSDDGGESFRLASRGLAIRHIRWLAYHPDVSDLEFAGTEPAAIFVSRDGAETWQERPEVTQLREENDWFLPYSPEAGCVRGFAFHNKRLFAAVEVGGLLISDDFGESWRLAAGSDGVPRFGRPSAGFIHPDVHSVAVHPTSPDLIYAPTGGGFYVSADGGRAWELRYDSCYCRAVWVDARDPDHLVLGPADSVDRNGRIEETWDRGRSWRPHREGLATPWAHYMVERFIQVGQDLYAVLSNGELLVASIGDWQWRRAFPDVSRIKCVAPLA